MRSHLFSLLLIVNLLMCPLRCLSCEANLVTSENGAPGACSCCSLGDDAPTPEAPEPCRDDCNCQSCICEGAVVEADVELPDSVSHSGQWVRPHLTANLTAALLNKASLRRSRAPVGQFLCGRDVRAAHQSWLI